MENDMTDALERAGRVIERERLARYESQTAAATAGGTSAMSWRKVEKGAPDVSVKTCVAVDRAFDWPIGTTADLRAGELTEPPAGGVPAGAAGYDGRISKLDPDDVRYVEAIIEAAEKRKGIR